MGQMNSRMEDMNLLTKTSLIDRIRRFARPVQFSKPSNGFIVHALHKSGSMFLYKLFADLASRFEHPMYSIHQDPPNDDKIPPDIDETFYLCPLRSFLTDGFEFPNMDGIRHLIHVRDPRDILVSEYFSLGWLHSDQGWSESDKDRRKRIQQISIDDFVLNESDFYQYPLMDRYQPVLSLLNRTDVSIVKYEQMVTEFPKWLGEVFEFLGLSEEQKTYRKLVKRYRHEFEPGGPDSHKRNVTPGDHQNKLSSATIDGLNTEFRPILDALGYAM